MSETAGADGADAPSDRADTVPRGAGDVTTADAAADAAFEDLLFFLAESRAFDFTGYKRPSLMRRVRHRMQAVGFTDFGLYHDYLQANPDEFKTLLDVILINVTSFFRDRESWSFLAGEVLPELLSLNGDEPLRIWSAGCAAGQEAVTLAILLAEALGVPAFRERVKIYATDVDEEALAYARQATYTDREMASMPVEYAEKYFDRTPLGATFRSDLRRCIIFGRNDLTRDAPISRIDLLTCRNTLMYFNAETQSRVIGRLGFAVRPQGVLFLGKAEMLLNHADVFLPVELKRRFFRRAASVASDPFDLAPAQAAIGRRATSSAAPNLRSDAMMASTVAQLVIDADGHLALANPKALELTGLTPRDVGQRFTDLDVSFRPVELRSHLEAARIDNVAQSLRDIPWHRGFGVGVYVDIDLVPLRDTAGRYTGTLLVFTDVSRYQVIHDELQQATAQLQAASQELQSTNEELETTNEELQSTVEELETTNEELQSTNEELETMNEELQSMNDELQSANEELRERSGEVTSLNALMRSILGTMNFAVIVLDHELSIRVWNEVAEDLWGVRADEAVGTHLLNLDIGLPLEVLRAPVRAVLADAADRRELTVPAVNRRGRSIDVVVNVAPLAVSDTDQHGVLLVMRPDVAA